MTAKLLVMQLSMIAIVLSALYLLVIVPALRIQPNPSRTNMLKRNGFLLGAAAAGATLTLILILTIAGEGVAYWVLCVILTSILCQSLLIAVFALAYPPSFIRKLAQLGLSKVREYYLEDAWHFGSKQRRSFVLVAVLFGGANLWFWYIFWALSSFIEP